MLDLLGTIGKWADLILLEANPLEDIGNMRRINAVVVNGRYLPKEALQKMLGEVESAANKKRVRGIGYYRQLIIINRFLSLFRAALVPVEASLK